LNRITKNIEDISTKVSDTTSSFIDKGGPALKVAGALLGASQMKKGRSKKKKAE
jgi:hypothetical protein